MVGHSSVLLSVFGHCLFLGLNVSDQVRADTAPACGRDTAQYALHGGGGNSRVEESPASLKELGCSLCTKNN